MAVCDYHFGQRGLALIPASRKPQTMRHFPRLLLLLGLLGNANALTPPPDNSTGFFAGEWTGNGEHGAFCYLNLVADGTGLVLIDAGSGDWLGARMQWRNSRQLTRARSASNSLGPLESKQ
jgi:hypothetical protein